MTFFIGLVLIILIVVLMMQLRLFNSKSKNHEAVKKACCKIKQDLKTVEDSLTQNFEKGLNSEDTTKKT